MHAIFGSGTPMMWGGFLLFVLLMLALDLGVFHKKAHVVSIKEATIWSIVWVAMASIFGGVVWSQMGPTPGLEFFTGYLIEKALAVDNLFVFVAVFGYFAVPAIHQHRVLFWGVLGALVMRAVFIIGGVSVLARFHWIIYIFGAFLLFTGLKMLKTDDAPADPSQNVVLKIARKVLPTTDQMHGDKFFVKEAGKWVATPLFLVLILIEVTDLVFAVDSIPAIFAVTRDPFLVFTSNIFAILGLRSMYFVLADVVHRFATLKIGLAFVLIFVGIKMALIDVVKVPTLLSLGVIATLIGGSIAISLWRTRNTSSNPAK
jgi:tellurite resistance protein TerC